MDENQNCSPSVDGNEQPNSFLARSIRWARHGLKWAFIAILLYLAILIVGLIPTNNRFEPAKEGIKIFLVSNAVHADIIVPQKTAVMDWSNKFDSEVFGNAESEPFVAFGWGDRGFFLETETWDDLKISTAANALLWPSESCIHVSLTHPEYYLDTVSVTISEEQYRSLTSHIESTFLTRDDGAFQLIPGYAYSNNDAFFAAKGRYHIFNTCNSWVGRGLKSAGVRVPILSPMPRTPLLYIENEGFLDKN